jgi:tetratricopeptide (TPR) repeat protein
MRTFPDVQEISRPRSDHAVIYWDYSLSEEDDHAARVDVLKSYLAARKPKTIEVYGFSQKVFPISGSFTDAAAIVKAISNRAYDGATRMDFFIDEMTKTLGKQSNPTDLVVFTNGSDTFELNDLIKIKQIPNKNLQTFLVTPGIGGSATFINEFSRRMSAIVLDQDREFQGRDFNLLPTMITNVTGSKNLMNINEPSRTALYPGDGLVLRGQFKKESSNQIQVTYQINGKEKTTSYKFSTEIPAEEDDNLSKLWAHARLSELMLAKDSNANEIKELSLNHQLMSPFTVMVVLEFCEDYAEFKISSPKGCRSRPMRDDLVMEEASVDDSAFDGAANSEMAAPPTREAAGPIGGDDANAMSSSVPAPMSETDADYLADQVLVDDGQVQVLANIEDTAQRDYGFEQELRTAKVAGEEKLYLTYLKLRKSYKLIPYFYYFTSSLFSEIKASQRAVDVLSNVVELKPGDARWFRVYASTLVAWGRAPEALGLYKRIVSLREEDPQSFRDYGLALEAAGQLEAALVTFQKVNTEQWDSRFEGVHLIAEQDLVRVSRAINANPRVVSPSALASARGCLKKFGKDLQDKIVITTSWDTDNTDVDLHVMEPSGHHVYFQNREPLGTDGHLSHDMTRGFGPEQYRNSRPVRGEYVVKLRYFSQNRNAISEGTFVRLDFFVLENGLAKNFTKNIFLKDGQETRTALTFNYLDKNAPIPFKELYKQSNAMLEKRDADSTLRLLLAQPVQKDRSEEALRLFNIARAYLMKRQFELVEEFNAKALAYNPNLVVAHYNNACAASLSNNPRKALQHLELLVLSLDRNPKEKNRLARSMQSDPDLNVARKDRRFKPIYERMLPAH